MGQGIFGNKVLNTSSILVSSNDKALFLLGDVSALPLEMRPAALASVTSYSFNRWENTVKADSHKTFFTRGLAESVLLARLRGRHETLNDVIEGTIQRGVSPDV